MSDISIHEGFVSVTGGELFFKAWKPDKIISQIPMILLHDSIGCVEMWRSFPEALCKALGRRVIAYDRLGFGRSTARHALPSPRFVEEEAEIYFPFLHREIGGGSFFLFGHSVGGGIAVAIAARMPEHCLALVTESSQAFVEEKTKDGIRKAKAGFEDPKKMDKLAKFHGQKAGWVLASWAGVWLSPGFSDWSLEGLLPKVKCPLLAIHGDQDEYGSLRFPEMIADKAGGPSKQLILSGCGHVPHREREAEVLAGTAALLEAAPLPIGDLT